MIPGHTRIDRLGPEMDTRPVEHKMIGLAELRVVLEPTSDHQGPNREQVEPLKNGEGEIDERPPMCSRPPSAEHSHEQQNDGHNLVYVREDSRLVIQTFRGKMIRKGIVEAQADGLVIHC